MRYVSVFNTKRILYMFFPKEIIFSCLEKTVDPKLPVFSRAFVALSLKSFIMHNALFLSINLQYTEQMETSNFVLC